jgi:hypothetical protein
MQYRENVLLWPKSDERKKAWSSSTCLLYAEKDQGPAFIKSEKYLCKLLKAKRIEARNTKLIFRF